MAYKVKKQKDQYVLVDGRGVVQTPMGTVIASRHKALMDELAADASVIGVDPTAGGSMVSLQSSYLDFGLKMPKSMLLGEFAGGWRHDYFFQRSADPEFMMFQMSLYGSQDDAEDALQEVQAFTTRQLMAAIVAGTNMGSNVLAALLVAGKRDVYQSSLGLCARFVGKSLGKIMKQIGGISFGGNPTAILYEPYSYNEVGCKKCLAGKLKNDAAFPQACAVGRFADKVKRFSEFPEETGAGA